MIKPSAKPQKNASETIDLTVMSRSELEQFAMKKSILSEELAAKVSWYEEQIRRNRAKRFGPSSEILHEGQISFFNEAEQESEGLLSEPQDEPANAAPSGKKQKGHKKQITRNLPRRIVDHVLFAQEQICPKCGEALSEMKIEYRTEIEWIPAKAVAVDHVTHIYSCRNCDKNGTEGTIIAADSPNGLFRNSLASPSLVSDIIYNKYALAVPIYRQERELHQKGILLDRRTLSNWSIKAVKIYLQRIYDFMKEDLMTRSVIHSDDTEVEVLHEPGRVATVKSYMWLYRTGSDTDKPIVLYEYTQGRAADFPITFLKGYCGYLQTDGYAGYKRLQRDVGSGSPGVMLAGCWAHGRRGFMDVIKGVGNKQSLIGSVTEKALLYIGELFRIERDAEGFTAEARQELRAQKSAPIMDEFFLWLRSIQDGCAGTLAKAVNYCVNQEKYLRECLNDGRLELTNNRAERSIKPFVIGRKNWLFCNTPNGAVASAVLYSIVETAKENGLDARAYIEYILTVFKDADMGSLDMADFMPWSSSLPEACRLAGQTKQACA